MLDQKHRAQIESTIARELTAAELSEAQSVNRLSDAQLSVGRVLVEKQLVLCIKYLQGLVPDLDQRTAAQFMDAVLHFGANAETWRAGS